MTQSMTTRVGVKHLDHLNLSVQNLADTLDWYARVFDFALAESGVSDDGHPWAIVRSGEALLCIYERPGAALVDSVTRKARNEHGIAHFALRLTDRVAFEARIKSEALEFSYGEGLIEYPASCSYYVADPTGYQIEVVFWKSDRVYFPPMSEAGAPGTNAHEALQK